MQMGLFLSCSFSLLVTDWPLPSLHTGLLKTLRSRSPLPRSFSRMDAKKKKKKSCTRGAAGEEKGQFVHAGCFMLQQWEYWHSCTETNRTNGGIFVFISHGNGLNCLFQKKEKNRLTDTQVLRLFLVHRRAESLTICLGRLKKEKKNKKQL